MIKLCRVDHRLLHGQVAFSWTNAVANTPPTIVSGGI